MEREERLGHDLAQIPIRRSEEVIQGYFTQPPPLGSMHAMMGQNIRADQSSVAEVRAYLTNQNHDLLGEFNTLANNGQDAGLLTTWIAQNLWMSMDQLRLENIRSQHPQTASIPSPWITDINAYNPGGPPIIVNPSPQGSPNPYDFSESDEEPDRIREDELHPNDMIINIDRDKFKYKPYGSQAEEKEYPITQEDKSDIRASTMLDNAYLGYRRSQRMPPLKAKSPKDVTVGGTSYTKGNKEGSERTVADEGQRILATERKRKDYGEKILGHHPDRAWTQRPQSEMGFHPQTKTANTLEGDASGLSSKVWNRASLNRMVVKEKHGHYAHTIEGREKRKERVDFIVSADELTEKAGQLGATIDNIPGFIAIIEELLEMEGLKAPVAKMGESLKDVLNTAQYMHGQGEPWSIAAMLKQEVLSVNTNSVGGSVLYEIAQKFIRDLPEIEEQSIDIESDDGVNGEQDEESRSRSEEDDSSRSGINDGSQSADAGMSEEEDPVLAELPSLSEQIDALTAAVGTIDAFVSIIDDLITLPGINQTVVKMGKMLKDVLTSALQMHQGGESFAIAWYIDQYVSPLATDAPGGELLTEIADQFKEHLPAV